MSTVNKVQVDGVIYDLEVDATNITGTVDTATSATKLGTTTVGTTKKPVYFSAGKPVEIGYTIEANVPSDAVFKYSVFGKSGSSAKEGLVPAPSTTTGTTKYLREDGTWVTPPDTNTTYSNFVKSGSGAKEGLVPAPPTTVGTTKYLREDGTWSVPPDTNTTYTPLSLGNGYGSCTTAASTLAKTVSCTGYNLVAGGIVIVRFAYAVPAYATLNINGKGARPIYYNGSAITAGIIEAGDTVTFMFTGSYYMLMAIDNIQELKKSVADGKTALADAISEYEQADGNMSFSELAEAATNGFQAAHIDGRNGAMIGTATASDVLTGKTFTNANGAGITGTMINNGAISKSISASTSAQTYTIPEGYHNGSGKVTVPAITATKTLDATNGAKVDMGGVYRYVNTNAVYNGGYNAGYAAGERNTGFSTATQVYHNVGTSGSFTGAVVGARYLLAISHMTDESVSHSGISVEFQVDTPAYAGIPNLFIIGKATSTTIAVSKPSGSLYNTFYRLT